jgi:hypothetical protein
VSFEDNVIPGFFVQIGSFTECIMARPGPWKRWALVAHRYDLDSEAKEVASPFGGIVYVCSDEFSSVCPIEFKLTFSGFARYPLYLKGHPEAWDEIRYLDVPWGEIETSVMILTIPAG